VLVQGRRRRFSRVGPGPLVKEQAYMSNGTLGWPRPSGRVTRSVRYVRLVLSISMSVKSGINAFKKYYLLFTSLVMTYYQLSLQSNTKVNEFIHTFHLKSNTR
jgi:hypothetical protein